MDDDSPLPAGPERTRIGWIGTGVMGTSMCGHLLAAGYRVTVFSRTKARARGLLEAGAAWADTPAEVARSSDVVFTMVGFPEDVRAVTLAPDGTLAGAEPGAVLVDMSTSDPSLAVEIAAAAADSGVRSLDAPVSGGDLGARNGTLSIMVGGEEGTYHAVLLHLNGVNDDRLKSVLWPDEAPTTATFNTTVSMTRSRLGRAEDGSLHFPHFIASGGVYRLGAFVTTDLARFEARVEHARDCTPAAAIETLRAALDLVRGKPFDGTRGFEWAFSEGLIANIEATVADAAHRLAQLYLDNGDPRGANWAAVQGLIAAPGDEVLYRDRMLACDLAGNPAGVETVWTSSAKSSRRWSHTTNSTPRPWPYTSASATGNARDPSTPAEHKVSSCRTHGFGRFAFLLS